MSADQHDDLLTRATAALREETAGEHAWPSLTRARLLESAARRSLSRRRRWLRWLLSIGGVFVVGTALARVPDYAPKLIEALRPALVAREASASRGRTGQARKRSLPAPAQAGAAPAAGALAVSASDASAELPSPDADRAAASSAAAEPVSVTPEALQPGPASGSVRRVRAEPRPRASAAARPPSLAQPAAVSGVEPSLAPAPAPQAPPPQAPPAIASAELELFRRAESLHRASDPRALEAWDAYLRLAQHGVLVPEARYNRALCLVRLGRKTEARAALAPFARGVYGSYRRREAEALLKALGSSS